MFKIHSVDDGQSLPWEYVPCSNITPKIGMAMILSSGKLAIATGTNAPLYVCMADYSSAVSAGTIVPVVRVNPGIIFETTFSASASDVAIGDKVTLHATSGLQVTATETNGVAEVVYKAGSASGDKVLVRFADPVGAAAAAAAATNATAITGLDTRVTALEAE